jgi:peptidoglycan/LPS O-acetylase OafA/YrhL
MFGTWRFFLASIVVLTHLYPTASRILGYQAVIAFFVLSGYLMTLVLSEKYGFSKEGMIRFCVNRFLRIYPLYWVTAAAAVALLVAFQPTNVHAAHFALPQRLIHWFANGVIIGMDASFKFPCLVINSWTLHVELLYYAALMLYFARSIRTALLLLIIGAVLNGWYLFSLDFTNHLQFLSRCYGNPLAAALPFGIGASIYHLRCRWKVIHSFSVKPRGLMIGWGFLLLFFAIANGAEILWRSTPLFAVLLYATNIVSVAAIVLLCNVRVKQPMLKRTDALLGALSYPIYLIHPVIKFAVLAMANQKQQCNTLWGFCAIYAVVLLCAWGLHWIVERPLEKLKMPTGKTIQNVQSIAMVPATVSEESR